MCRGVKNAGFKIYGTLLVNKHQKGNILSETLQINSLILTTKFLRFMRSQ